MNDRIITLLDNYDMTVLRTWKGRGAILCETEKGIRILKEYTGPKDKLCVLEAAAGRLKEAGFLTDCIVRTADGELCTYDRDHTAYILKEYKEGRECSVTDTADCVSAVQKLAGIHKVFKIPLPDQIKPWKIIPETESAAEREEPALVPEHEPETEKIYKFRMFSPQKEYERYNKELKRIWKFLREKSTKTDFEVFLLQHYGFFMDQAQETLEKIYASGSEAFCQEQEQKGLLCHGDFQYHNILFTADGIFIMNYEKCLQDVQIRDFYLFFRKIMEKNNWNQTVGDQLIAGYNGVRSIDKKEMEQLYLRLSYPEKFRKVVSCYYNSGKSWIPGKNREKLERLLLQEKARQNFLRKIFDASLQ